MKAILPERARNLVDKYMNIRLGSWMFPCPYFMNERGLRNLPIAYSGKGLPEEIEAEAEKIRKKRNYDLKYKNAAIGLMLNGSLGVDCSGFVVNVLNEMIKETSGKTIFETIKYPNFIWGLRAKLRPRMNISAGLLTDKRNSEEVSLSDLKPGDMVRRGAHHVMLVEWVDDSKGKKKIGYVHADVDSLMNVQRGELEVVDDSKPLWEQKWSIKVDKEKMETAKGQVRRLKI